MNGGDSFDSYARQEAKRYLARKRLEGMRVIHRLDIGASAVDRAGTKAAAAKTPEADAEPSPAGAPSAMSAASGDGAGRRQAPPRTPETGASAPTDDMDQKAPPSAPAVPAKIQSIRYTYRPEGTSQASLFSDATGGAAPDLGRLDLGALEGLVAGCTRCGLCRGRTNTVFGTGHPRSKVIFIGEAPGREEDLQGVPFVGRAGRLLTKILASVNLARDEVYIANILKCRPPDNRNPTDEEKRACKPYLHRQIELIEPALIVALGLVAGQSLLETKASLSVLRGGEHYYNDIRTIVTYHPAALLRNPNYKRAAWDDIKEVRKFYDEARARTER